MGEGSGITPFQSCEASCVICEKASRYTRLKTTLYKETKRDIDLRPLAVVWSKKVYPQVDPKLFYFWQCPQCFFTADYPFFLQPFKDGNMSATRFRKQFLKGKDLKESSKAILQLLNQEAKDAPSLFMTGLRLNLLACWQWEQVEEVKKGESLPLGSFYLRLAWMYHDLKKNLVKSPKIATEAKNLIHSLKSLWPELPLTEVQALKKSLHYYEQGLIKSAAIQGISAEVNLRLIITRLKLKTNQLAEAKQCLVECKNRARSYELLWKKKQKDSGHFTASALEEMEQAYSKASAQIQAVELIYERIEMMLSEKELQEAKSMLQNLGQLPPKEQAQHLQEQGISEATRLKLFPIEKKKSLMGYLKSS